MVDAVTPAATGVTAIIRSTLIALVVLSSACAAEPPQAGPQPRPVTDTGVPESEVVDGWPQQTVDQHIAGVEVFWDLELRALYGVNLRPLEDAIPYRSSDDATLPTCNGTVSSAEFYAENAFYCRQEHLIVYDAETLVPQVREDFGEAALAVLLAHEYAHAVQDQAGLTGTTLELELQADCFAGAWAAGSAEIDGPTFGAEDLGGVHRSYREFSDSPDVPPDDPDAHGSGAERVAAFMTGFSGGAADCVPGR